MHDMCIRQSNLQQLDTGLRWIVGEGAAAEDGGGDVVGEMGEDGEVEGRGECVVGGFGSEDGWGAGLVKGVV